MAGASGRRGLRLALGVSLLLCISIFGPSRNRKLVGGGTYMLNSSGHRCIGLDRSDLPSIFSVDTSVLTGRGQHLRDLANYQIRKARSKGIESLDLQCQMLQVATAVAEGNLPLLLSMKFPMAIIKGLYTQEEILERFRNALTNADADTNAYLYYRAMAIWTSGGLLNGFRRLNYLAPHPKWPPIITNKYTCLNDEEISDSLYVGGGEPPSRIRFKSLWMLGVARGLLAAVRKLDQERLPQNLLDLRSEQLKSEQFKSEQFESEQLKSEQLKSEQERSEPGISEQGNKERESEKGMGAVGRERRKLTGEVAVADILGQQVWEGRSALILQEVLGEPINSLRDLHLSSLTFVHKRIAFLLSRLPHRTQNNKPNPNPSQTCFSYPLHLDLDQNFLDQQAHLDGSLGDLDRVDLDGQESPVTQGDSLEHESDVTQGDIGGGERRRLEETLRELQLRTQLEGIVHKAVYHPGIPQFNLVRRGMRLAGIKLNLTGLMGNTTKFQNEERPVLVALVNVTDPFTQKWSIDPLAERTEEQYLPGEVFKRQNHLLDKPSIRGYNLSEGSVLNRLQLAMLMARIEVEGDPASVDGIPVIKQAILDRILNNRIFDWTIHAMALVKKCELGLSLSDRSEEQFVRSAYITPLIPNWRVDKRYAEAQIANMNLNESIVVYTSLGLHEEAICCLLAVGDLDRAGKMCRFLLKDKVTPRRLCMLGDATKNISLYEEAWDLSHKTYARPQFELAVHFMLHNDSLRGVQHFELGLRADSTNADRWFQYGCALQETNNTGSALSAYRRCLSLDPGHLRGLTNLGVLYSLLNRTRDAVTAAREACNICSTNWQMWENFLRMSYKASLSYHPSSVLVSSSVFIKDTLLFSFFHLAERMKRNDRDADGRSIQIYHRSLAQYMKDAVTYGQNHTRFWILYLRILDSSHRGLPDSVEKEMAIEGYFRATILDQHYKHNKTAFLLASDAVAKLAEFHLDTGVFEKQKRARDIVNQFFYDVRDQFDNPNKDADPIKMLRWRFGQLHFGDTEDSQHDWRDDIEEVYDTQYRLDDNH
ncbi:hypothetical protein AAMO2058_001208500 [Amorphochlora amoebiformis]